MMIITFPYLVASILFCFVVNISMATLPPGEVESLREIAKVLGKTDWNFSVDPCSGESGWKTEMPEKGSENAVICRCPNDTNAKPSSCHVICITLKAQSLPGTLPPSLDGLPFLEEIHLDRNFLNGTIPRGWGSSQLVNISLNGNRLTGSLPKELGNISTLANLTVEFNQLSGSLPLELGNLTGLQKLHLTSNYFTGELPDALAKVITLKDLRIGDNNFTGKIPDFIQSWTNLERLYIQASGLVGPIPQSLSYLTKLTDLRISDLNGAQEPFPDLSKMASLKILILRSCNITGPLPVYLGTSTTLKTLDLSFNKLIGQIPSSYANLRKVQIFLTGNLLSGSVPKKMLDRGEGIDLSSNNLSSGSQSCLERSDGGNLFRSSSMGNTSGIIPCLRSTTCQEKVNSFRINCGGESATVDRSTYYEADSDPGGSSCFYSRGKNWAFSTVGEFMDDERPKKKSYIAKDPSLSGNYFELYKDARLSPISLSYYGFCLQNGNYSVKLHFMEITFTSGNTYGSLGRRIFDIYVQGKQVQKDFNIANEAGGVGKSIIKTFNVSVTDATLEIRLYWAGKGTTGIPTKGVYGPMISAISVNNLAPRAEPSSESRHSTIPMGAVVGIVAAVVIFIILLLSVLWWKCFLDHKDTTKQELKGLDLQTGSFTLRQIKAATNNFDTANKIGEGGFGSVFKGVLSDGTIIAVKQLSSKSQQGNREFVNEIGMISAVQHPHLVKLYGCCIEGNQLLLVYEYMENNCLARALFGPEEFRLKLDWPTRYNICLGIAQGLAYLHEESRLKIVHRDIKATNVLLDKNLKPKISDFGLARLHEEDDTHISTKIAGTYGYMAPEYAMHGYLTDKADVYSFGIVALEIVSGKNNTGHRPKENMLCLLDWAHVLEENGNLMDLVDRRLGSEFDKEEAMMMIDIAFLCTNVTSSLRPTMSSVVSMLDSKTLAVNELVEDSQVAVGDTKMKKMMSEPEHISGSTEGPWTGSTASGSDLYPLSVDSEYFIGRE